MKIKDFARAFANVLLAVRSSSVQSKEDVPNENTTQSDNDFGKKHVGEISRHIRIENGKIKSVTKSIMLDVTKSPIVSLPENSDYLFLSVEPSHPMFSLSLIGYNRLRASL